MDDKAQYVPPCRIALSTQVTCSACQKRLTAHTLKYRHICTPMVDRIKRASLEGNAAVQRRAETTLEAERAAKYAHLLNL